MPDVKRDLTAKTEKFSIEKWIAHWKLFVKFCEISEMEVQKKRKKGFDIGNSLKFQLFE